MKKKGFLVKPGSLDDAYFYGRENQLRRLYDHLEKGQHTLFAAPRQVGKTALAFKAIERYSKTSTPIDAAHVDLWRSKSYKEASTDLINDYMKHNLKIDKFSAKLGVAIADVINTIVKSVTAFDLKEHVVRLSKQLESDDGAECFAQTVEFIEYLASMRGHRLVLFIDEFQDFTRYSDGVFTEHKREIKENFLKKLRSIIQKSDTIILFAAGSEESTMQTLFETEGEAFYKSAKAITVKPIEKEAYSEHFEAVCNANNLIYSQSVANHFYYLGGGIPYYLSSLGQNYINHLLDDTSSSQKAALLAIEELYDSEWRYFDEKLTLLNNITYAHNIYVTLEEEHVLSKVAKESNASRQSVHNIAGNLVNKGFLISKSKRYYPALPLLYLYLKFKTTDEVLEKLSNMMSNNVIELY
jgi:hypothetical protein